MDYPLQPPRTIPAYSAVAPGVAAPAPETPREPIPSTGLQEAGSDLSIGDAAWVVMRTMATAAECLNYVCRKVAVLSGLLIGGFKGLLLYAHENLNNRTVRLAPSREQPRANNRPTPQPGPLPQQNLPWEDYVWTEAKAAKHSLESTPPGSNYRWEHLGGIAIALISSLYLLGIPGVIMLYAPGQLLGAESYISFDSSPPVPHIQQPAHAQAPHPPNQEAGDQPQANATGPEFIGSRQPPPDLDTTMQIPLQAAHNCLPTQSGPSNQINQHPEQPFTALGQSHHGPTRTTHYRHRHSRHLADQLAAPARQTNLPTSIPVFKH